MKLKLSVSHLALVKRPQMQVQDEMRYLKTAAAMADAGEVRNLVESLWTGEALEDQENPMEKVAIASFLRPRVLAYST